jgi:succinate dehydrogenase / fumarate reductase membrane anchor subunit
MSVPTHFKSGRAGEGDAFVSDHAGSRHARFMRLSSYALAPLGLLSAWWLSGVVGQSAEGLRAVIGRPFPALTLIAFASLGMIHAREGMHEIILDYIHDPGLKRLALAANKGMAAGVAAIWTLAIMIIAAPK